MSLLPTHLSSILECLSAPKGNGITFHVREQKRLLICIWITGATMILEFAGGLWTHSLALISDAGHMFSHLFSLCVSYVAIVIATREADEIRSYGFYRAEILAALFNGLTLLLIVIWIFYAAIQRMIHPTSIATAQMVMIALIGLVVNLSTAFILKSVSGYDLNVRSAFVHMLGDTVSSLGVVVAAIVIGFTGFVWLDPLASILIALVIAIWSIGLLKDAIHILLESTPKHISVEDLTSTLRQAIPQIKDLHHIHIWELTSQMPALTAHVVVEDLKISESEAIRNQVNTILQQRYGITHTNLQFECRRD